ncbi:MAG: DUF2191 domain-containing protein [Actinobacteria bacterium]|nr:DUF2191 domain-containing protein [Actinomycetota bacterium]MCB8996255.1 DUF2191 domain-containing protein [Actinomycetota bacterium]MCB9413870.1 DUF2191 domain-containing protein [Actinomycetota bacterium]HRY09219.1 CopG family transcriptional regulator [Candidatus Nanopelagicales bacterium]
MRTTVTIDNGLLAQAKELAARSHRTLSSVLEDALRETLARQAATSDRPGVSIPVGGSADDRPLVDILDREALADALGDNGFLDPAT